MLKILKMKNKILTSLVIAVPLLLNTGVATTVSASSINNYSSNITYKYTYSFANFQTKLDALVVSGTITQAQKTTILDLYYNGKITIRETFKAQLDALVASGTIAQSQEYSILNVFTNWGSTWKIPAPTSGTRHDNPVPNAVKQNSQTSNGAKNNNI
ncbi:hypothetical protein ACJDU8_22030 [Clostridium sp. WILCCON 0269]|uniref:Uncharacterized protein n=1 Tax=Candidatus Clostridium eludens TaxID=3381663 RepID=A0ABW8SQ50_9CLOT